jgi:argininosuccinate lyase
MLASLTFNRERLASAATDEVLAATDVADLLVKRGIPFRRAHGIVGGLVRAALEQGKALSELTEAELAELAPDLRDDSGTPAFGAFYGLLEQGAWLESKVSAGGTALSSVREQLSVARHLLGDGDPQA